jgi:calcineurin-like phosphoesterase family protein
MNKALTANWNKVVRPEDTVIHVGDFAFTSFETAKQILAGLNGTKILVRGNHDRSPEKMMAMGFAMVVESMTFQHHGQKFLFSHHPIEIENARIQILDEIGAAAHIHGHQHNATPLISGTRSFNVSVENTDFHPMSMEVLTILIN